MRCALVIPSWSPEDIFPSKTAGSQINYWQPLGTLYVASSLINSGHDVIFLNGAFMSHAEILNAISKYKPQFTGIYSTAFGWNKAKQTADDINKIDRKIFVAVGGPYPIAMQEKCLEETEGIDAVVTGEGEVTTAGMLDRLSKGENLSGLDGVIFRDNGTIIRNPARSLIKDLDSLPFPARELLGDSGRYIPPPATYKRKPVAVVITSRGCNRKCIFCFQIDRERTSGIRYRSIANVIREIELCLRQGYREIKFIDDTLAADYDRAMALAQEIRTRKLDFTWFASACVNQVDKPLLKAFKAAGCWAILFGAESGVQKNLNAVRKGTTLEQIRNAVKIAKDAGLKVFTPFIFGIPGETYDEALQTIEFACDLNPDVANFHSLTPFPGTELSENIDKYGSISGDLTDLTYQGAAFVPYTMTRDEIIRLRQLAFRRFYSRPRFILKRISALRNSDDLRAAFTGFKSLLSLWLRRDLFIRRQTSEK